MKRLILSLAACAVLAPATFAADAGAKPAAPAENAAPAAKPVKLGSVKIEGVSLVVSRVGELSAGKDLAIEIALPANAAVPKSIKVWVSNENETKALESKDKVEAKAGEKHVWSATVKVPAKIESKTQLWITVEPATGKAATRSLQLKA